MTEPMTEHVRTENVSVNLQGSPGDKGQTGDKGRTGETGETGKTGRTGIAGEDTFMSMPLWLGWRRWTWVKIAFAWVVLMGAFLFYTDHQFERAEAEQKEQAEVDEDYIACDTSNDVRQVVRDIVNLTDDGSIDLTDVPGFVDLDAETRQFLISLRDATADTEDTESFKEAALALLPIRDCEKEYPEATGAKEANG